MQNLIKLLVIFCCILCPLAQAEDVVCLDQDNKVVSYQESIDITNLPANCHAVSQSDTAASRILARNNPIKYMKWENNTLSLKSAGERTTIDEAINTTIASQTDALIDQLEVGRLELVESILELIQEKAAISITKQEVAAKIKAKRLAAIEDNENPIP